MSNPEWQGGCSLSLIGDCVEKLAFFRAGGGALRKSTLNRSVLNDCTLGNINLLREMDQKEVLSCRQGSILLRNCKRRSVFLLQFNNQSPNNFL